MTEPELIVLKGIAELLDCGRAGDARGVLAELITLAEPMVAPAPIAPAVDGAKR